MIIFIYQKIKNSYFKYRFRKLNVRFGKKTIIDRSTTFEGFNSISNSTILYNTHLGIGTYIGYNDFFLTTKIGRFCSIGSNVKTIIGNHPLESFVSTHPSFFSPSKAAGFTFSQKSQFNEHKRTKSNYYIVEIGNDVWIGDNVSILEGVTIGNGAVIGAGSVVTKDIAPYSINAGVPCKTIRNRFKDDDIAFLQNFKWWEKGFNWIKENSIHFNDIHHFRQLFDEPQK